MRDFIKKYEIWIFLVLAPIFNSLLVFITSKELFPTFIYTHGRFYFLLFILIVIIKFNRGNEGIKDIFRPILKWKINPIWYAFSLLIILTVVMITLLFKSLYTGVSYASLLTIDVSAMHPRAVITIMIWAFVGEVIWVSYSIRELTKITKPFYASQIVGFFWALWWVPIVILNVGVVLDVPVWPSMVIILASAGMCTVIYGHTKSGLCVLILQFMTNFSLLILPISPRNGGVSTYTTFAVIYFITMLFFMYFLNPIKKNKPQETLVLNT